MLLRSRQFLPIINDVWRLALPVIFTNLLQTLVNVIDIFMVGRLGPLEVAAIGMGQVIRMLVLVGVLSVTAGTMSLAAQAKGRRDAEGLSFVSRQTLILALFFGIALSLFGLLFAEPILTFLGSGSSDEVIRHGVSYLHIYFLGGIFLTLNFSINALMQGAGDTVTPLILVGIINSFNVLLNYIFMFGPGPFPELGLDGAALGTVVSRGIGALLGIILFYSGRNVIKLKGFDYRPNFAMFKDILGIGVPSGLQGIVRNMTQVFVVRIVTSTSAGAFGAAALAIGSQIESLATMPVLGINVAATALIGSSLGAWQTKEAQLRGNIAILFSVFLMLILSLPLMLFAPQLVLLFEPTAEATILSAGSSYLRINGLSYMFVAIAMVSNGALRGAGDTLRSMFFTMIGRWFVSVPVAYILALKMGYGINGVWIGLALGNLVQAILLLNRWLQKPWINVALKKSMLYRKHLANLPENLQEQFLEEIRAPIMRQKNMAEFVDEEGVSYQSDLETLRYTFQNGGFEGPNPLHFQTSTSQA
ncbi:MAG: MATE family efflux transporter [Trueperaceae bacterium]|nr:MATE family efflux transporter [Trueperaceae bacterium]